MKMNTWKIKSCHFYSHDGRRRDIEFKLNGVTIITGKSSTGKSAVIDTVNYCFGSSTCDIGSHIEARCSYVAILLTNMTEELFICRKIPKPSQKISTMMQVINSTIVNIPDTASDLNVKTNKEDALLIMQSIFIIGEVMKAGSNESKISIRNLMPYLFLTDDVIINKKQSLYGLEGKKSRYVIDSYPYFIGAIDEQTLSLEREMYGLQKGVKKEKDRLDKIEKSNDLHEKDVDDILLEAINLSLIDQNIISNPFEEKINFLITLNQLTQKKLPSKSSTLFNELTKKNKTVLKKLTNQEKELKSAYLLRNASSGFSDTLIKQQNNLSVSNFFKSEYESSCCPVCEAELPNATEEVVTINKALQSITKEIAVSKKRVPKIEAYVDRLLVDIEATKEESALLDRQLKLLVQENSELEKIENRYVYIERLKGKIDFFLKQNTRNKTPEIDNKRFQEYGLRIKEIESLLDPELIEEQKKAADSEVSKNATEIMSTLPTALPLTGNSIHFSSRNMTISILESAGTLIPMNKIKSDQNYLAIHISLILGLHKEFQKRDRPVPGFIFIDQVSRPYYPADKNSEYKNEIKLNVDSNDREVTSVKEYFDLFFDITEKNKSLQLIVLEHAYFENDERFKSSVKYRWTDETSDALIPNDWCENPKS